MADNEFFAASWRLGAEVGQKEAQTWEPGGWVIARLDILVWRVKVQVCAEHFSLAAPASDWGSPFA